MKISEMIKNLQEFMAEHGDLECWYSEDDEGNAYHPVYFKPSMYFVNKDEEVYQSDDLEYLDLNEEEVCPICIIN